jgi:hypothetical protein
MCCRSAYISGNSRAYAQSADVLSTVFWLVLFSQKKSSDCVNRYDYLLNEYTQCSRRIFRRKEMDNGTVDLWCSLSLSSLFRDVSAYDSITTGTDIFLFVFSMPVPYKRKRPVPNIGIIKLQVVLEMTWHDWKAPKHLLIWNLLEFSFLVDDTCKVEFSRLFHKW